MVDKLGAKSRDFASKRRCIDISDTDKVAAVHVVIVFVTRHPRLTSCRLRSRRPLLQLLLLNLLSLLLLLLLLTMLGAPA